MNEKFDVFEILGEKHNDLESKDQEQASVTGPDFNDMINQLRKESSDKKTEPLSRHEERRIKSRRRRLIKLLILVVVMILFCTLVVNVPKVVGSSMVPELREGDRVVVNRLARTYEVGNIIVFETSSGEKIVKRIVAVEGDVVNITPENEFYRNEDKVEEEYIYTETEITDAGVSYPMIISEGRYFVLGDNRVDSTDSRNMEIGLVKEEDIIGKVILCIRKPNKQ